jgi:hypothetical protein
LGKPLGTTVSLVIVGMFGATATFGQRYASGFK